MCPSGAENSPLALRVFVDVSQRRLPELEVILERNSRVKVVALGELVVKAHRVLVEIKYHSSSPLEVILARRRSDIRKWHLDVDEGQRGRVDPPGRYLIIREGLADELGVESRLGRVRVKERVPRCRRGVKNLPDSDAPARRSAVRAQQGYFAAAHGEAAAEA